MLASVGMAPSINQGNPTVPPIWRPRGDASPLIMNVMHPPLRELCQRIRAWRLEIGRQSPRALEADLQKALSVAQGTGLDPVLWIVVVAMCERWFRIATATERGLERELQRRLSIEHYSPYADGVHCRETPSLEARYLVHRLQERWDPDASEEMAQAVREGLKASVKKLARALAGPFLVVANRPLPPRPGTYPNWGPWVAAAALYADVRARYPRPQDPRASNVASALLKALQGKRPDKAEFRRQRHVIQRIAPSLMERMVSDLRGALKAYEKLEAKWRVEYLLWSGTFDSLEEWEGMQLIVGRGKPT